MAYPLHKLSYGLYILTTSLDKIPYGCIINTAFQITSKPAQLAISCNKDNFTHNKVLESKTFAISVLIEDTPKELIEIFGYHSGRDIDKFVNNPYEEGGMLKLPLYPDCSVATFECSVVNSLDVGTHTIIIGEVLDSKLCRLDVDEMTYRYYSEIRKGISPKNAPTYIDVLNSVDKWRCSVCGYLYDKEKPFTDLESDWRCPICGANKSLFIKNYNIRGKHGFN